jgi:hypothetical protein
MIETIRKFKMSFWQRVSATWLISLLVILTWHFPWVVLRVFLSGGFVLGTAAAIVTLIIMVVEDW